MWLWPMNYFIVGIGQAILFALVLWRMSMDRGAQDVVVQDERTPLIGVQGSTTQCQKILRESTEIVIFLSTNHLYSHTLIRFDKTKRRVSSLNNCVTIPRFAWMCPDLSVENPTHTPKKGKQPFKNCTTTSQAPASHSIYGFEALRPRFI